MLVSNPQIWGSGPVAPTLPSQRCLGVLDFFGRRRIVYTALFPRNHVADNRTPSDKVQEKKTDRTNFLDRFNALSRKKALTTSAACDLVGISRSMYYEIRDGKREPSSKMWDRLSDAENSDSLPDNSSDTGKRVNEESVSYLSKESDPFSQMSDKEVLSFFELVMSQIEAGEISDDLARGARKLFDSVKFRMLSNPQNKS